MSMKLLYPERRTIDEAEVIDWAQDVWNDAAPRRRCCRCGIVTVLEHHGMLVAEKRPGEFAASDPRHPHEVMDGGCDGDCNDEPVFDDDDDLKDRPTTLEESVLLLEDLGVATFAS